jgi:hypothetical protein
VGADFVQITQTKRCIEGKRKIRIRRSSLDQATSKLEQANLHRLRQNETELAPTEVTSHELGGEVGEKFEAEAVLPLHIRDRARSTAGLQFEP